MNEPNLPPEHWRPLFDKIGVEFGYRPLAAYTRMNHTRVRRLLLGGGTTDEAVRELASAFRVSPDEVYRLRGEEDPDIRPFTLPEDAGRLTESERRVIRSMVRALLDARELGNEDQGTQDAPSDTPTDGEAGTDGTSKTRAGNAGANDKPDALIPDCQGTQDDFTLAARKGETEDEKRERLGIPYDD